MVRKTAIASALFLFLTCVLVESVLSATCTWTGSSSANWNNAANWSGGLPVAGDTLVFPASATRYSMNNDFPADTEFNILQFKGDGYSLTGNGVVLTNASYEIKIDSGVTGTLSIGVDITNDADGNKNIWVLDSSGGNAVLTINGALDAPGGAITLNGSNGEMVLNGAVSAAGYNNWLGSSDGLKGVTLAGDNSGLSGAIYVHRGLIKIGHTNALGSVSGATTLRNRAAFSCVGCLDVNGFSIAEPITMDIDDSSGTGFLSPVLFNNSTTPVALDGDLTITDGLTYASPINAIVELDYGDMVLSGNLKGNGSLFTKTGVSMLTLNAVSNDFSGGIVVSQGTLRVNGWIASAKTNSVSSGATLGGDGTIGAEVTVAGDATLFPGSSASAGGVLSVDALTMSSGSTYAWLHSNAGTGSVLVVETNGLSLPGAMTIDLRDTTSALSTNMEFTLFTYQSSAPLALPSISFVSENSTQPLSFVAATVDTVHDGGTQYRIVLSGLRSVTVNRWAGDDVDDARWTSGANWEADLPPGEYGMLVFGTAVRQANTNDFTTNHLFESILFEQDGFTLSGNGVALAAGGMDPDVDNQAGTQTIELDLTADVAGGSLDVVLAAAADCTLTVKGSITGDGVGLAKKDDGTLILSGANDYTGATVISQGCVRIEGTHAGGYTYTTASGATLCGTGTISLADGSAVEVHSGAMIQGGADGAPGTLMVSDLDLQAGAVLVWDRTSNATSLVEVTDVDGLSLGTSLTLRINDTLSDIQDTDEFVLVRYPLSSADVSLPTTLSVDDYDSTVAVMSDSATLLNRTTATHKEVVLTGIHTYQDGERDITIGVIRWDVHVGNLIPQGTRENEALSPYKWHSRVPFYTEVISSNEVSIVATNQSTMDQEIQYAAAGGLGHFAFLLYDDDPTKDAYYLGIGLERYLSSPQNDKLPFAVILPSPTQITSDWERWIDRFVEYFQHPNYQTVLGNRPLVYTFRWYEWADGPDMLSQIEAACVTNRIREPYFVDLWSQNQLLSDWDALSDYATWGAGSGTNNYPYSTIAGYTEARWQTRVNLGFSLVPLATAGWNGTPRFEHGDPGWPSSGWTYDVPTATQIAEHVECAVDFVKNNPVKCEAKAVLIYAWNEYSEGGWLCPGLTNYDGTARLDALGADYDQDGEIDIIDDDDDGDSMSDDDEEIAGTDPLDEVSVFQVSTAQSGGEFSVQFDSVSGREYDVLKKDDLLSTNSWQVLTNAWLGTGGVLEFTDPSPTNSGFYRIRVAMP